MVSWGWWGVLRFCGFFGWLVWFWNLGFVGFLEGFECFAWVPDKSRLGMFWFLRVVFSFSEFCLGRIRVEVPKQASSSSEVYGGEIVLSGGYLSFCSHCPHIGDIICWHQWLRKGPDAGFPVYFPTNCVNSNRSSVAFRSWGMLWFEGHFTAECSQKRDVRCTFFLMILCILVVFWAHMKWELLLALWLNIFPRLLRNKTYKSHNIISNNITSHISCCVIRIKRTNFFLGVGWSEFPIFAHFQGRQSARLEKLTSPHSFTLKEKKKRKKGKKKRNSEYQNMVI